MMGIDGIGKPVGTPNLGGLSGAGNLEAGLEPARASQGEATAAAAATDPSLLEQLQQGQLTCDQYLQQRVEQAVAPFVGALSPEQLEHVRATLREQLQLDPTLVELTRRVTANVR